MKKCILTKYLAVIVTIMCLISFTGCQNNDNSEDELTEITVCGSFTSSNSVSYAQYIFTTMDLDFYKSNRMKAYGEGVNISTGNVVRQTLYGTYLCYEEKDVIFILWDGYDAETDIVTWRYDGLTIYTGTVTLNLIGSNVNGEFAGKAAQVTYSALTGGEISGKSTQYVKKGGNCSEVTAIAKYGYEFTGWSDGETSSTRQDSNVYENLNVTAQFKPITINPDTPIKPTKPDTPVEPIEPNDPTEIADYGYYTAFVYNYGQSILDSYNKSYGDEYIFSFRICNKEEILSAFKQSEYEWRLLGVTSSLDIETVEIVSALIIDFKSTDTSIDATPLSMFFAFNIKSNDKYNYCQLSCNGNSGELIDSNELKRYNDTSIYYLDIEIK